MSKYTPIAHLKSKNKNLLHIRCRSHGYQFNNTSHRNENEGIYSSSEVSCKYFFPFNVLMIWKVRMQFSSHNIESSESEQKASFSCCWTRALLEYLSHYQLKLRPSSHCALWGSWVPVCVANVCRRHWRRPMETMLSWEQTRHSQNWYKR